MRGSLQESLKFRNDLKESSRFSCLFFSLFSFPFSRLLFCSFVEGRIGPRTKAGCSPIGRTKGNSRIQQTLMVRIKRIKQPDRSLWFVWFVWFVWAHQTNESNESNEWSSSIELTPWAFPPKNVLPMVHQCLAMFSNVLAMFWQRFST